MNDLKDDVPVFDVISKTLGTATPVTLPTRTQNFGDDVQTESVVDEKIKSFQERAKQHLESDFNDFRVNMKQLIEDGMEAVPELMKLLGEAESPRMYDSAANFIKTVADLSKNLLEVTSAAAGSPTKPGSKFIPGMGAGNSPVIVNQPPQQTAIFVGTSEEIFKTISKRNDGDAVG